MPSGEGERARSPSQGRSDGVAPARSRIPSDGAHAQRRSPVRGCPPAKTPRNNLHTRDDHRSIPALNDGPHAKRRNPAGMGRRMRANDSERSTPCPAGEHGRASPPEDERGWCFLSTMSKIERRVAPSHKNIIRTSRTGQARTDRRFDSVDLDQEVLADLDEYSSSCACGLSKERGHPVTPRLGHGGGHFALRLKER